jgi:hypothetical protein
MSDEAIAQVVHYANIGMQAVTGDDMPSQPWMWEPRSLRAATTNGVRRVRQVGVTPQENHENWRAEKHAQGWVYGRQKDPEAKTHPCLVPWEQLPESAKRRTMVFHAVVTALTAEIS